MHSPLSDSSHLVSDVRHSLDEVKTDIEDILHHLGDAADEHTVELREKVSSTLDRLRDIQSRTIAFDRWRIDVLRRELDRLGLDFPLVEWGQGFKDMSPALDALEAALLNEEVAHGNHPVLTMCAANATVTKDPAGNRKLDKSRPTGRIDGLQALAMAMGVATRTEQVAAIPDEIFFV